MKDRYLEVVVNKGEKTHYFNLRCPMFIAQLISDLCDNFSYKGGRRKIMVSISVLFNSFFNRDEILMKINVNRPKNNINRGVIYILRAL
ncbi:hypothetical protein A3Q56_04047 [Intoshia linei]|uniref:Uncharacterized protein n=1 Tax=Intoshia linei TaxID=1819745 RepID=A0A177B3A1_9BILA|nr:hypothetical protein A3Q56_04047 [Intoshia linei]